VQPSRSFLDMLPPNHCTHHLVVTTRPFSNARVRIQRSKSSWSELGKSNRHLPVPLLLVHHQCVSIQPARMACRQTAATRSLLCRVRTRRPHRSCGPTARPPRRSPRVRGATPSVWTFRAGARVQPSAFFVAAGDQHFVLTNFLPLRQSLVNSVGLQFLPAPRWWDGRKAIRHRPQRYKVVGIIEV
jgi:hypothetical protein